MNTLFKEHIYAFTQLIPKGKVATYKQLAILAGNPHASRLVGRYMSRNTHPEIIPCHRVVASTGNLTGYAFGEGIETKRNMLIAEGVSFINNRVNLAISQWNAQEVKTHIDVRE